MSDELDRLRREGEARLAEADRQKRAAVEDEASERRERDDDRVRTAIGRYRYRALRSVNFALAIVGLPIFAIAMMLTAFEIASDITIFVVMGSCFWMFGLLFVWDSTHVWRASKGAMKDERRYVATLPFEVVGYFEWLIRSSGREASMRLLLRAHDVEKRHGDLRTLIAAVHPNVTYEGGGHFLLEGIQGGSDDQRVRVAHDLFDRVLVPLSRETKIEQVRIVD